MWWKCLKHLEKQRSIFVIYWKFSNNTNLIFYFIKYIICCPNLIKIVAVLYLVSTVLSPLMIINYEICTYIYVILCPIPLEHLCAIIIKMFVSLGDTYSMYIKTLTARSEHKSGTWLCRKHPKQAVKLSLFLSHLFAWTKLEIRGRWPLISSIWLINICPGPGGIWATRLSWVAHIYGREFLSKVRRLREMAC